MNTLPSWRKWLERYRGESGYPFMARALEHLIADDKVEALWISGSRATANYDKYSDIDIRIYSPPWTEKDLETWMAAVESDCRPHLRFSRFSPTVLNYEFLFGEGVPIDLLIFTGDSPMVSSDSVVLKCNAPLQHETSLKLNRNTAITAKELLNLMEGVIIDQQKFKKLFARGDTLSVHLLLDAQRFALLRLGYIAACGFDCGARSQHTLASFKAVQKAITSSARSSLLEAMKNLEREEPSEARAAQMLVISAVIFSELRERFPLFLDRQEAAWSAHGQTMSAGAG